jgi:dTDP-4-dehydrorhamnose reductase
MILLTGAAGMLGSEILRQARLDGIAMAPVVRTRPLEGWENSHACDLADAKAVARLFDKVKPDAVIHAAAWTDVEGCEKDPDRADADNCEAASNLAATSIGVPFVGISTDSVFSGDRGDYIEADELGPLHRYGWSKLQGEALMFARNEDAVILRTAIYGQSVGERPGLFDWLAREFAEDRSVSGFDDLRFSPLSTDDFAALIFEILSKKIDGGVYHAGSRDSLSKYEFAVAVAEAGGKPASLVRREKSTDYPGRLPRPRDVSLVSGKLAAALGHRLPSARESLQRHVARRFPEGF